MSVALTERQKALFRFIAKACRSRTPSPTQAEMTVALHDMGFPISPGAVPWEIKRIADAKLLTIIGGGRNRIPMYRLAGNAEAQTTPRKRVVSDETAANVARGNLERRAAALGWPLITEISGFKYDQAVERREFAEHNMNVKRGPYQIYTGRRQHDCSLVGCSAEMAAL